MMVACHVNFTLIYRLLERKENVPNILEMYLIDYKYHSLDIFSGFDIFCRHATCAWREHLDLCIFSFLMSLIKSFTAMDRESYSSNSKEHFFYDTRCVDDNSNNFHLGVCCRQWTRHSQRP